MPGQESPPGSIEKTRRAAATDATGDHNHLAPGTRLGEFEILDLIGEGGFGIVYLAYDHSLQRKVALKEYMPAQLASRAVDASVSVRSEKFTETFEAGRRSFVNEARLLAQFDQPALVKVHRFWEANGTAYMAMPLYEGITLRETRKRMAKAPDVAWIRRVLAPVIEALDQIHAQSCFHRDIAPDNIMLLEDGRPVLLDFGAARRVIGDATQALTVILKPGYAPIEQYAEVPGMKQGAWTDVYALAAVIHHLLTGETPPVAVGRIVHDEYRPLAERCRGAYPDDFLQAVDHCLAVRPEDRPQSMAEVRRLLGCDRIESPAAAARPAAAPAPAMPAQVPSGSGSRNLVNLAIIAAVVAVAAGGLWFAIGGREPAEPAPQAPAPTPPPPTPAPTPAATPPVAEAPTPPRLPPVPAAQAIARLVYEADPGAGLRLDRVAPVEAPGGQTLALRATAEHGGYVYVLALDPRAGTLSLVFPNATDRDNQLAPGRPLVLPRPGWAFPLGDEARQLEVLVLHSERPRRFPKLPWEAGDGFASLPLPALERILAAGDGVAPLAGEADCGAPACDARYGAASALLAVEGPAPKPAVVARPAPEPVRPPRGATEPAPDPEAARLKAERDYMKQLNRDLDKLLGEPSTK